MSVSLRPESRLRHGCSKRYLSISPLHRSFHFPLLDSSKAVSNAMDRLSRTLSRLTYFTTCARFTPSDSGQRLPPTSYRSCWPVVSWGFSTTVMFKHVALSATSNSSHNTEVYDPKAFIPHAAVASSGFPPLRNILDCSLP